MNTETCQSCQQTFEHSAQDLAFYQKVNVPAPTYCPACRMQRRLAHRNERTLYRRKCDLCAKDMVAIYPVGTPWPVYCASCWWSDTWDAKSYGQTYDPSRPFFDQFKELQAQVPRIGLLNINSENSEYTNNAGHNTNCYLIFAAEQNENCSYGRLVQHCRDVIDCAWTYDSENCYNCSDCHSCFGCFYAERCQNSQALWFCFDVRDSSDCILSFNQRHAKYMIENKQFTKEEYEQKKQELLGAPEKIEALKERYQQLKAQALVKYAYVTNCEASSGDFLWNCQNTMRSFDARKVKDGAYLADIEDAVDCVDGNNMYEKPEHCYNMMGILQCYDCKNCSYVFYSANLEYCDNCHNTKDSLGCIGLRKDQFCILNKEYSQAEYEQLAEQIRSELRTQGIYGQFLPASVSPHGYNETLAADYFPLEKAEALAKGFRWQEEISGTYGQEDPANHIYTCRACQKNFRLLPAELAFYEANGLPLPQYDFECRYQAKVRGRTPRQLWHRSCMCSKDGHEHEGQCSNEFDTAYSPDRSETVYCERCYQKEVV